MLCEAKHAFSLESNVVWQGVLVTVISSKYHKWHTVMTCQGQPFCSHTLT